MTPCERGTYNPDKRVSCMTYELSRDLLVILISRKFLIKSVKFIEIEISEMLKYPKYWR